jgi:hypothetical protein
MRGESGNGGRSWKVTKRNIIIAFMPDETLKQFQGSAGWEAGVDVNVALYDIGDLCVRQPGRYRKGFFPAGLPLLFG